MIRVCPEPAFDGIFAEGGQACDAVGGVMQASGALQGACTLSFMPSAWFPPGLLLSYLYEKPCVKAAHQFQDCNYSINGGASLLRPSPAKCLLQAAVGPAAQVCLCHQSCKWQFRHNLTPCSSQLPCNITDFSCIARFLMITEIRMGSTIFDGV